MEPTAAHPETEPTTEAPADVVADASQASGADPLSTISRDIAEVPSVEIISTAALHLMSAAAVNLGLAEDLPDHKDLDEARSLIHALAGLLDASVQSLGHHHAAPLRDGLKSLQLAFREASSIPDEPGAGPGEKYTGPVLPSPKR
ncbi:DUF1844 domain-containing protein [Kribbella sp. NBC_01245]|uniref:DUF1844 domain-containing protein n=1 Tax=Kribbella sp. NBC_01245 TaxID=2903578 RepID=UPI002E2C2290|nr:DUF1844 domain-containing protein [Kribbella sp. NBC_01245]